MVLDRQSIPVLIVGGGLAGLSAALFLAWQKVPCVLVEKHVGSSPHPRAIGYTARTMELLRAVGLGDAVPEVPADFRLVRARIASLDGEWFERSSWTPKDDGKPKPVYSPSTGAAFAQDRMEPILRDKAVALGADIRLDTELVGFEQDATGVTASLRRRDDAAYTMRADYMVAADGGRSAIREALKIGQKGRGHIRTVSSVLFRAPLDKYLESGVTQFEIEQPGLKAFLTTYHDGRWVLMFTDEVERDEAALPQAIFAAIGRADMPVEIIATGRWELTALVAESFTSGRVFLAGDAAHTLPPTRGGYGANTGIADAHNLAWKLAAVVSGAAAPPLLDTYDAERRPVAWRRHQQIFARPDYKHVANGYVADETIIDDDAMEFGQLYRSSAILGAGDDLPPALRPDRWAGQPGTRAPHVWVFRDGAKISTLDLFQPDWVLLAAAEPWRAAAARVGERLGMRLNCIVIGADIQTEDRGALLQAFGLTEFGASLIRPDGYVAWRSSDFPSDPENTLGDALGHLVAMRRAGREDAKGIILRALAFQLCWLDGGSIARPSTARAAGDALRARDEELGSEKENILILSAQPGQRPGERPAALR